MSAAAAQRIKEAIRQENGPVVARFFDIEHLRHNAEGCEQLVSANISKWLGQGLWMEAFTNLLKVPLQKDDLSSFNIYNEASAPLIRDFKDISPRLVVPCIKSIARTLRYFAAHADYNESVNQMQKLLRLALTQRTSDENPLLSVVNELMAVYFLKNNFKQAQALLKNVEVATTRLNFSQFPVSEVACFCFNKGRIYAVYRNIKESLESLTFAFEQCPQENNRRLILAYLIPVQLCCGKVPSNYDGLLREYNLYDIFGGFARSVIDVDLALFDDELDRHQLLLMQLGLFELMMLVRRILLCRIVQSVHTAYENNKVAVSAIHAALNVFKPHTMDEAESVVALLIEHKMIRAYIHHGYRIVVFAMTSPFTPITPDLYC